MHFDLKKTLTLNTQTSWTESCFIRILFVDTFEPDHLEFESISNNFVHCLSEEHKVQKNPNIQENLNKKVGIVPISKEHKVYILPLSDSK